MTRLQELINKLHAARTSFLGFQKSEKLIQGEISASNLGVALKAATENRKFWEKEATAITEDLRKEALADFALNKSEKIMDVINVKEEWVVPEYDQAKAVEWAKVNAPFLITESVDKASFETLVLAGKISWLISIPQAKVTKIASDLTPAITLHYPEVPETVDDAANRPE